LKFSTVSHVLLAAIENKIVYFHICFFYYTRVSLSGRSIGPITRPQCISIQVGFFSEGHLKKDCPDLPAERRKELQELLVMKQERKGQGTGRKKNKRNASEALDTTDGADGESGAKRKPLPMPEFKHKKVLKDKTGTNLRYLHLQELIKNTILLNFNLIWLKNS